MTTRRDAVTAARHRPRRLAAGLCAGLGLIVLTGSAAASQSQGKPGSTFQQPGADAPRTFVFECRRGGGFVARADSASAWVFIPGRTVNLPRVSDTSGARYEKDGTVFWSKEDEATLAAPEGKFEGCRNNRRLAIWEDAKLRGVDFRATGNEPGWYLEIAERTRILLVTDYGQSRQEFRSAPPSIDQAARRTVYVAESGEQRLEITIEGRRCVDTMSGEAFTASVSVTLDDRKYSGCGRALH